MGGLNRSVLVWLFVAAVVSGCGGGESTGQSPQQKSDASKGTASESTLPDGAEKLVGRWAHYDVVAYEDVSMKTLIISTGFADIEMRDGELWNRMRFCHADMANNQKLNITMSDAATSAIVPIDTVLNLDEANGSLQVNRPATPTGIGIKLADPANEKLPTDPADPRIFDADGDGNPGVTSSIGLADGSTGEIYIARREIFEYNLTQESPDELVGAITDSSEQLVVGANNPVFLAQSQWKQIEDPQRNPVIWKRVDSTWDCARLASERAALFPPQPEVDW